MCVCVCVCVQSVIHSELFIIGSYKANKSIRKKKHS